MNNKHYLFDYQYFSIEKYIFHKERWRVIDQWNETSITEDFTFVELEDKVYKRNQIYKIVKAMLEKKE